MQILPKLVTIEAKPLQILHTEPQNRFRLFVHSPTSQESLEDSTDPPARTSLSATRAGVWSEALDDLRRGAYRQRGAQLCNGTKAGRRSTGPGD